MTCSSVAKILIKNGKAIGVALADGKKILAKRLVASSTDPSTLVLKLIGEDYVDPVVVNNIERLEWGDSILFFRTYWNIGIGGANPKQIIIYSSMLVITILAEPFDDFYQIIDR